MDIFSRIFPSAFAIWIFCYFLKRKTIINLRFPIGLHSLSRPNPIPAGPVLCGLSTCAAEAQQAQAERQPPFWVSFSAVWSRASSPCLPFSLTRCRWPLLLCIFPNRSGLLSPETARHGHRFYLLILPLRCFINQTNRVDLFASLISPKTLKTPLQSRPCFVAIAEEPSAIKAASPPDFFAVGPPQPVLPPPLGAHSRELHRASSIFGQESSGRCFDLRHQDPAAVVVPIYCCR